MSEPYGDGEAEMGLDGAEEIGEFVGVPVERL